MTPNSLQGVLNGAEASSSERNRPYGIDTTTAGTLQERYFMILAGLLEKNLAVQIEIRDMLTALNKPTVVPETPAQQTQQRKKDRDEKK